MNKTINELEALTELASGDELIAFDVSDGKSKKITNQNLLKTVTPVDSVTDGDMHSVTSNAVAGSLSYSTTETLTGGTWIDGNPIYRKVFVATENKTISSAVTVNGWSEVFSIDKLVQSFICSSDNTLIIGNAILPRYVKNENRFYFFVPTGSWGVSVGDTFTIEYTKTTD